MKYDRKYRQFRSPGERGVALFFALGILAVLIVIILVFADRARTDLKVASAYAHSGQARHLAESALSRALIQLQKSTANNYYFYSSDDAGNADTVDWLWKIDAPDLSLSVRNPSPIRWQYVKAPIDGQNQIIGRFAYHVVGYNPMDLNALLIHQKGLCSDSAESTGGSCTVCAKRLGRSVAELNFDTSPFTSAFTKTILNTKALTYPHFDYLKYALNLQNRNDIAAINERFAVAMGDSMKELDVWQADKDGQKVFQRFNLNRKDWNTISVADLVSTPSATTLSAVNADLKSADFKNILWLAKWKDTEGGWGSGTAKAKQIAANLLNYNRKEDQPVVSNIAPANWGSTVPEYTGNKRTWYLNESMFTLNVQPQVDGPHIVKDAEGNFRYKYWNLSMIVKLQLSTEIINMYKDVYGSADPHLKYFGTVSFTYKKNSHSDGSNNAQTEGTCSWDLSKVINPGESAVTDSIHQTAWETGSNTNYKIRTVMDNASGNRHLTMNLDLGSHAEGSEGADLPYAVFNLTNINLSELKIILSDVLNGQPRENVDYAHVRDSVSGGDSGSKVFSNDSAVDLFNLSFQVQDARHNLLPACWEEKGGVTEATLKEKNTFTVDPANPSVDKEDYSDPTEGKISTAYIRHAPMESLWELGAIHRAAPWQTINLKKPNPANPTDLKAATEDFSDVGGDVYRNGDFLLLDQVTFRSSDDTDDNSKPKGQFGKINLIGPLPIKKFSWDALFRDAKEMKTYDATSATETLYVSGTPDIFTNLENGIADVNSGNIFRRSDIFRAQSTNTAFWDQFIPSTCTTDAMQEERICRFINLTKVHRQGFDSAVVVVLAQSIKDVGGVTLPVDWDEDGNPGGRTDANMAATNAGYRAYNGDTTQTIFGIGTVANANEEVTATFGKYDNGIDKITGTAKMIAFYKYDNIAKKWKLIRVKHEE